MATAALIWGLAFVAQRVSLDHLGAFTFNALRFTLGALSLLPLVIFRFRSLRKEKQELLASGEKEGAPLGSFEFWKPILKAGSICGSVLFFGANLQQLGMLWTNAGKAAFLTSFYLLLVPLAALFWGKRPGANVFVGAVFALAGIYLLSVTEAFTLTLGDSLEIIGAVFWAAHILLLGHYSTKIDPILLSLVQFGVCSFLSFIPGLLFETTSFSGIQAALGPLLYAGIASVGIAYTLQVFGQRGVAPGPAALILSLETVFAAAGAWLLIGESMDARSLFGCGFMLVGMVLAQIVPRSKVISPTKT